MQQIKTGQRWRTRDGNIATITTENRGGEYPVVATIAKDGVIVAYSYTQDGHQVGSTNRTDNDLIELLDHPVNFAGDEPADANSLAAETLTALGWRFDGQCWVQDQVQDTDAVKAHPLYPVLIAAIEQAMYGKGERHGGNVTPFLDQPWTHYAKMHGRGFLTGQAAKKLEEAASTREGKPFEQEVLGAIVYSGMSILKERGAL